MPYQEENTNRNVQRDAPISALKWSSSADTGTAAIVSSAGPRWGAALAEALAYDLGKAVWDLPNSSAPTPLTPPCTGTWVHDIPGLLKAFYVGSLDTDK